MGGRGCEGENKTYLLVTLISLLTHSIHLSFTLQFCSLPFTATLFSHSFPNLSKNLRRSCAFIALWYKVGVASRRIRS